MMPDFDLSSCSACSLRQRSTYPSVPGYGPSPATLMIIGEAPGRNEAEQQRPFVGEAGRELRSYLRHTQISDTEVYFTNVCKCWPGPGDPTPTAAQVSACIPLLRKEIEAVQPSCILAVGVTAMNALWELELRGSQTPVTMEEGHGQPFHITVPDYYSPERFDVTVVPTYHPAATFRRPGLIPIILSDMDILRRLLDGEALTDIFPEDQFSSSYYQEAISLILSSEINTIALDTESDSSGALLCISISVAPGEAYVLWKGRSDDSFLREFLADSSHVVIMHNALHDVAVLQRAGYEFRCSIEDTMIMAYLLQEPHQGLKALAKRHCGMFMSDYDDVIGPASHKVALDYLFKVALVDWGIPSPVSESTWDKKSRSLKTHLRKPQPLTKRIKRILADVANDKRDQEGNPVDPTARWLNIDLRERELVEAALGPMSIASLSDIPTEDAVYYSARDADATLRLHTTLLPILASQGLLDLYYNVELPIIPMVVSMMESGLPVDPSALASLRQALAQRLDDATILSWIEAGHPFNPLSPDQVSHLLFTELKLPPGRKTDSGKGYSTGDEVLAGLVVKHPVVSAILETRRLSKLINTYILPFERQAPRVHCGLKLTRTPTGRMAASEPNLMAVPVRRDEGQELRRCFVARPGYHLFSSDLSQIEMRLIAHVSQDESLIRIFRDNRDVHSETAASIFGISLDQVTSKQRDPSKTVNFGVAYGMTEMGLYAALLEQFPDGSWSIDRCREFLDDYFRLYPGVRRYIQDIRTFARRNGYVQDIFGRRRDLPKLYSTKKRLVEEALREAVNTPIQSSAAGVMKLVMTRIWEEIEMWKAAGTSIFPLLQIHDDLLSEVVDVLLTPFAHFSQEAVVHIGKRLSLSIPLATKVKIGHSWGDLKEV